MTGRLPLVNLFYGDEQIGTLSCPSSYIARNAFNLPDLYYLDVYDESDSAFLIALVIALDNIFD